MTIDENIERALENAVRDFVTIASLPVAWPNMTFTPDGGPYLEARIFRNENTRLFVKGSAPHMRQGILQLTVRTALNLGAAPAMALAGAIVEQFPADREMFSEHVPVTVERAPSILTPIREAAYWAVPVSIRFRSLI